MSKPDAGSLSDLTICPNQVVVHLVSPTALSQQMHVQLFYLLVWQYMTLLGRKYFNFSYRIIACTEGIRLVNAFSDLNTDLT